MHIHDKKSCFWPNVLIQRLRVTLLTKKSIKFHMKLDKRGGKNYVLILQQVKLHVKISSSIRLRAARVKESCRNTADTLQASDCNLP